MERSQTEFIKNLKYRPELNPAEKVILQFKTLYKKKKLWFAANGRDFDPSQILTTVTSQIPKRPV